MKIQEFQKEWKNISRDRRIEGLQNLMQTAYESEQEEFVNEVLRLAAELEILDGFGTEGADI